jgi:hypothetical protein
LGIGEGWIRVRVEENGRERMVFGSVESRESSGGAWKI